MAGTHQWVLSGSTPMGAQRHKKVKGLSWPPGSYLWSWDRLLELTPFWGKEFGHLYPCVAQPHVLPLGKWFFSAQGNFQRERERAESLELPTAVTFSTWGQDASVWVEHRHVHCRWERMCYFIYRHEGSFLWHDGVWGGVLKKVRIESSRGLGKEHNWEGRPGGAKALRLDCPWGGQRILDECDWRGTSSGE